MRAIGIVMLVPWGRRGLNSHISARMLVGEGRRWEAVILRGLRLGGGRIGESCEELLEADEGEILIVRMMVSSGRSLWLIPCDKYSESAMVVEKMILKT